MMIRPFLLGTAALLVACNPTRTTVEAPSPIPPVPTVDHTGELSRMGVDAVLWQGASAEAYWLYKQSYEYATWKLEAMLETIEQEEQMVDSMDRDRRPLAVIVDIDETVLDNSPYQITAIRNGRTFSPTDWKAWTDKAAAKASPGAREFLMAVRDGGCEVFYVTNRDRSERASTLKNLQDLGFPNADDAHLLLMEGTSDKTARRAQVRSTHNVLLLVGDQLRDFDERFKDRSVDGGKGVVDALADSLSERFILLPNPMYGTFRDVIQGKGTDAEKLQRTREWFDRNGY